MNDMFELYDPFPIKYRGQRFGENATSFYKDNNLKGHTTDDWVVPFGTKIPHCVAGYVYAIFNSPDPAKYRAVYVLVETDSEIIYEASYGHLDKIFATVGTYAKVGDILGTVGNTGDVYSGGVKVTTEEQRAGSKKGAHLHGVQIRKCKMVQNTSAGKTYLHDGNGIFRYKGHYIEVVNFNNGYNGCVDPEPFRNGKVAIPAYGNLDLSEGDVSLIVDKLQGAGLISKSAKTIIDFIKRLVSYK